jgi:LPS-assembly lipoprotein
MLSLRAGTLALLFTLAGCGFRPVYGVHSTDPRVAGELATIHVEALPDREGQLVHNALLTLLNPKGEPTEPRFELAVEVSVAEAEVAEQKDQTASRAEDNYAITYTLYHGDQPVTTGAFARQFSYDFLQQHYANISARADIGRRAAQDIAQEIRNRMADYFIRAARARAKAAAQAQSNQ